MGFNSALKGLMRELLKHGAVQKCWPINGEKNMAHGVYDIKITQNLFICLWKMYLTFIFWPLNRSPAADSRSSFHFKCPSQYLSGTVSYVCMYIGFKTSFYVVRHLDSIASYLPTSLHLGFFRSWPSLYLPSSFSSVFLVLYFLSASTSMLIWLIFLLPFFEHGRTM